MKSFLKFILVLGTIALVIYSRFLYIDSSSNCHVTIIPTILPSNLDTKSMIEVLKNADEEEYARFCKHIEFINKNPNCGGFDGECYDKDNDNTIYIGSDNSNPLITATLIVNETCQVIQNKENRRYNKTECYQRGNDFLRKILIY